VIDLHSHVLWGVDDGCTTLAETLTWAKTAAGAGTRTVVATPHVSWDWPQNTSATIAARVREANHAVRAAGIDLEILPGAEIALSRAADLPDEELDALGLGGGPWLLVEPPFADAGAGFERVLDHLLARGRRLLIAHPERCAGFVRRRDRLEHYVEQGCLTQVTSASISGTFGGDVQRFSLELLHDGLVHDVASDAHAPGGARQPVLGRELEEQGFGALVDHLCRAVPEAVIAGAAVPPLPPFEAPARRRRGLFRR
jgi:protein-tyrosine phosphatase